MQFSKKFSNEQICRDHLEQSRWKGRPCCPHCASFTVTKFKDGKLWKCNACYKQFTVRVGTIFEESRLPLQKWFLAIFLHTSLKKGISSLQLSRYLGITQRSSWFMLQRIRYAIEVRPDVFPDTDVIEVDEAFIGGQQRRSKGKPNTNKSIVIGAAKRYSKTVIAKVIKRTTSATLNSFVTSIATKQAAVITDDHMGYRRLEKIGFSHSTVVHSHGEYATGLIHVNTIEGFWSHLKRGINGIYHQVSSKHMQKYISEYAYRFSTREMTDFERFENWIGLISNVRLKYRDLVK